MQTSSVSSNKGIATPIQGTPFVLVGNKERGFFIGYGNAQITPPFKTKKEALKHLQYNHWEVICNMVTFTVEHWQKLKEQALTDFKAKQSIQELTQTNHIDHQGMVD